MNRQYVDAPCPYRLFALIGALTLSLFFPELRSVAVVVVLVIVGASMLFPELSITLQADMRARARADSHNRFVDVLTAAGFIDAKTNESNFVLRCENAPEPDIFVMTARQPGKTKEGLETAVSASLLAFDATSAKVEQLGNSTFRITYSKTSEIDSLTNLDVGLDDDED